MARVKKILLFIAIVIIIFSGVIFLKGVNTFSIITTNGTLFSPAKDERWDVLILGNRGEGAKSGGILTDSIMVLSYKKETGKVALFSIPRDLWVDIPGYGKQRINFAYVAGEMRNPEGEGLKLAKEVVSNVTGLDIDFGVVVDIWALKEIVDILGGIEIYEDKYFSMDFYHYFVKIHPGKNYLSGNEVLAYVGSRDVGADFGRMKRQQKVLLAIKEKAFSLGLITRPDKIWSIFDSLAVHIKTDIPSSKMRELIQIASGLEIGDVQKVVFDTSNYLYSTHTPRGAYILLPKAGDFSEIQEKCENIFEEEEKTDNLQQTTND